MNMTAPPAGALEACPFCGYAMDAEEDGVYQKSGFIGASTPVWAVTCASTNCNASIDAPSPEQAIAAWNRRTHGPALLAALRLRERVKAGGYVVLPRLPTYQMAEAIGVKWESGDGFPRRYAAMIDAAPTADDLARVLEESATGGEAARQEALEYEREMERAYREEMERYEHDQEMRRDAFGERC